MTSPILTAGSTPDELYFFYHVYGSSVQLEAAAGNGWTPLWSAAWQGGQDQDWALARVAIPPDAGLLRFVGTLTGGSNSSFSGYGGYGSYGYGYYGYSPGYGSLNSQGVALDGIGLEAPNVDFLGLSCDFRWHTCFWFNAGNSAWQHVASETYASWFLEASTSTSVDQTFVLESARFTATSRKGLLLEYQLEGSSSVSLQSHLEGGTWTSVFLRTGDTGNSWQMGIVTIPDGAVALRIVGNVTAAGDVVRLDRVEWLHVASSSEGLACSFEDDFCSWLNDGQQSWQRRSGSTSSGPQEAVDGVWYLRSTNSSEVRF